MHVFICWSGRRSRWLAQTIDRTWLPAILGDKVTSFVSFADIEKGEGWFDRLLAELAKADAAVVCLTPENLTSPWMHFEAGMVSRMGRGGVFTYFLGTKAGSLRDPLAQIQVTVFSEEDTNMLALKLAERAGVAARDVQPRLAGAWSRLAAALQKVAVPTMEDIYPSFDKLFERKTFQEPLEECVDQIWLRRYEAARTTAIALDEHRREVLAAAELWQIWLYNKLIQQVDGYVSEIKQYLLVERAFEIADSGRIDFSSARALVPTPTPRSLSTVCARRCREIRHAVSCLSDPRGAPVLPEALSFAKLRKDQFDDKKRLVHALGVEVDSATLGLRTAQDLERCAQSFWDYDRIVYYKVRATERVPVSSLLGLVEHEIEKIEADDDGSKMVLHYAVKTLVRTIRASGVEPFDSDAASRLVRLLRRFLDSEPEKEHAELRANVEEIRVMVESGGRQPSPQ